MPRIVPWLGMKFPPPGTPVLVCHGDDTDRSRVRRTAGDLPAARQLSGALLLRLPISGFVLHVRRRSVLLSASAR
ncbi:hypothetical protein [Nocardia sp. NPDC004604]|uniref:hypothetical protein n=1 Tax=Nocardia sp. NPDC004604 TaxID=3157013 RepID=UPI0033A585E0